MGPYVKRQYGDQDTTKNYISKEMYQLDATIYYDFILINSLYMFWTFTCPSSGVLIYRLFTATCGVMPCEKYVFHRA